MWLIKRVSNLKLKYVHHQNEVLHFHSPSVIKWHREESQRSMPSAPRLVASLWLALSPPTYNLSPGAGGNLGFKGLPYVERGQKRGNSGNNTTIQ